MNRLFVDTSAWFAFANRSDSAHEQVRRVIHAFEGRLITSNYVFDETVSLCLYRLGHQVSRTVGSALLNPGHVDMVRVTVEDERVAWRLFCERPDQRYSFTDCASFALMRRLGLDTALALDADFITERFKVLP